MAGRELRGRGVRVAPRREGGREGRDVGERTTAAEPAVPVTVAAAEATAMGAGRARQGGGGVARGFVYALLPGSGHSPHSLIGHKLGHSLSPPPARPSGAAAAAAA